MISHNVWYKVKIALEITYGTTFNMHLKLTFYKESFAKWTLFYLKFYIIIKFKTMVICTLNFKGPMKKSYLIWII